MPQRDRITAVRRAPLLAISLLAACTANTIDLAPPSPSRPTSIEQPPFMREAGGEEDAEPVAASGGVTIDPRRSYDLLALIDLAQRTNPETREAWERARQAALGVGLVESSYLPQISAEAVAGYQHATVPIPTNLVPGGLFTTDSRELLPTLAIKWLLFDFGRRAGAETAARAQSFVANVAFTGAHQKLIFNVSRDYFSLNAARGRLHVADDALKNAQIVDDAVRMRRGHGLATTVEVAESVRQTAEARFNLARATGDEHAAYHALIASMGITPSALITVADDSAQPLPTAPAATVDKYVDSAMSDRPDIVAALGRLRGAEAKLDVARAEYNPTLGLEAQAFQNIGDLSVQGGRYFSANEPGGNILLKFSWPLDDGGARDARVGIARADVGVARSEIDQSRNTAAKQVTDAYDGLATGLAEHVAAVALQDAAWSAYDAALDAYGHGVGTYTDLVNSETALTRSQSSLQEAHAAVFTAAAALAFATGSVSMTNAR
jgi:outer membrane protein